MLTPKMRRQNEVLVTLAQFVGKNIALYDTILQYLRTLFLHTNNPHYCTLRVSLLMELHDLGVTEITSMDPCHKFAWCLDACIRENNFDSKRSREMQFFLENTKKGQDQVVGDLAMALADPYAVNFISQSIIRLMNHQITNEALPRDNHHLHFLLRLLNLGLHAYDILKSEKFCEPQLSPAIVTKFLPILMSFMVDDQVRSVNAKLSPDDRESALTIIEHSGPPPDAFQTFVTENRLAAVLTIYYTAHAARQKDRQAVTRVFGTLSMANDGRTFADQYLHVLVAGLVHLGEEFSNEELCSVVFDEIFIPAHTHSSTSIHLMKLIWHTHYHLPPLRLVELMRLLLGLAQAKAEKDMTMLKIYGELDEKINRPGPPAVVPGSASKPSNGGAGAIPLVPDSPVVPMTPGHPSLHHQMHPMMTPMHASSSSFMSPFYGPVPGTPAYSSSHHTPSASSPFASPFPHHQSAL